MAVVEFISGRQAWVLLLLGIFFSQILLYLPSFTGRAILAPTDLLLHQGALGPDLQKTHPTAANALLMDAVQVAYPFQEFAAREIRAGRLPLWNPYSYGGAPFVAMPSSTVFSPFAAIYYLFPTPRAMVWIQLLHAFVAGIGAFLYLRKVGLARWPAIVGGWCFPLIGFHWLWLTFWLGSITAFLPWALLAIEEIIARPLRWGGPLLALAMGLMIHAQHLQTAAFVLAGTGAYGIWRWLREWLAGAPLEPRRHRLRRAAFAALLAAVIGCGLGAVKILPVKEYLQGSLRMEMRKHGFRDDDPAAFKRTVELSRMLFPYLWGSRQEGSRDLASLTMNESGAQGYAGFVMILILAPLGFVLRTPGSHRWFWIGLWLCAAAPLLQIPILRLWEQIPPFNLSRNNRAVALSAWAAVVLGAAGLHALLCPRTRGTRIVGWISAAIAALACGILLWLLATGPDPTWGADARDVWPWLRARLFHGVMIAGGALVIMLAWLLFPRLGRTAAVAFGLFAVGELTYSAWGYNPQSKPETYYPERPFITYLKEHSGSARVYGIGSLLYPNVPMMYGLREIRGYDSVDPLAYIKMLWSANPRHQPAPSYAVTMYFLSEPSPILDMLAVKLIAVPGKISALWWEPVFEENGVTVYRNTAALPRAYVPRRAEYIPGEQDRLQRLADRFFDPRAVVFLNEPADLPSSPVFGDAEITEETPGRVSIRSTTDSEGFVVLADTWAPGWEVRVDGKKAMPLTANHALRAVRVPAGEHAIEWNYRPRSLLAGGMISAAAALFLVGWAAQVFLNKAHPQGS